MSRFTPLLRKLNVKREEAVPISLLRLRCSVKTPETQTLENQLAFLFTNRLIAQPEFFVLERWRLGDALLEKELAHSDEGGFWNGAYLVDGEIEASGTVPMKVNVKVFARSPEGKEVQTIEAQGEGGQLPELAALLASKVASLIAKQPIPATSWMPEKESHEYVREAEWALQGNLLPIARAALESSGALGNHERDYFRLGANIYSELVNRAHERDLRKNPEPIRHAQLALDSYERFLAAPAPSPTTDGKPKHWTQSFRENREYVAMDVLNTASDVLRDAFNQGLRTDPTIADIRSRSRELFATIMAWKCQFLNRSGAPHINAAASYPYWYDTPADALGACRKLLAAQPPEVSVGHMDRLRYALLRCDVSGLGMNTYSPVWDVRNIPHLVGWSGQTPENCATLWRDFIGTLLASPDVGEQSDGMLLQIVDEKAASPAHLQTALEKLWNYREQLLAQHKIGPVVATLDAYLQRNTKPGPDQPSAGFDHAYRLRWLLYFLEHSKDEDVNLLALWAQDDFTEQEADRVCKALRGYRERASGSNFLRACQEIENNWLDRYPNIRPTPPPGTLRVTQFFPIPELLEAKAAKWAVQIAPWGDKLWLCVTTNGNACRGALYGVALSDFKRSDAIELPPSMPMQFKSFDYDNFDVGERAFYYRAYGQVSRYDRGKQLWTAITLPGDRGGWGWSEILPEGDDFFIGRSSNMSQDHVSGVWKWIAATGEFETISSSRRRPAQNKLDDCGGYGSTDVFRGPQGQLAVRATGLSYLYNAGSAQWEPIPGVGGKEVHLTWHGGSTTTRPFSRNRNLIPITAFPEPCRLRPKPCSWNWKSAPAPPKAPSGASGSTCAARLLSTMATKWTRKHGLKKCSLNSLTIPGPKRLF